MKVKIRIFFLYCDWWIWIWILCIAIPSSFECDMDKAIGSFYDKYIYWILFRIFCYWFSPGKKKFSAMMRAFSCTSSSTSNFRFNIVTFNYMLSWYKRIKWYRWTAVELEIKLCDETLGLYKLWRIGLHWAKMNWLVKLSSEYQKS